MSVPTIMTTYAGDDDAPVEAHTWEELAEYERGEAILYLLRRISCTCLRSDRLRVLEREEWVCSGTTSDSELTCTQHLLLFGHVRHRHREALLALIRQMRLHVVRDLSTSVTIGLQPGDPVPYVLLEPLAPSQQTNGYARWNRVYYAMRCGILKKLYAREEKIRQRLRSLVQEPNVTSSKLPSSFSAMHCPSTVDEGGDAMKRAETLRFYNEEFGQLFSTHDLPNADGKDGNSEHVAVKKADRPTKQFQPVSEFMTATEKMRVSLAQVAAHVPTILVAWSARYPESVEWLRAELFNDKHLKEIRMTTGLSGRFAVLMDKDPWVSFAEAHGGLLPRLPTKHKGFKIDLLRPLPKRAQIVLVNVDDDAVAARAVVERLRKRLKGWVSPEVDLLSLWSGPEGLQSELAMLFNMQTLPFVVQTRPAEFSQRDAAERCNSTINTAVAPAASMPVISDISCDPIQVSKRLFDVPDTPRSNGATEGNTWHSLGLAERTRIMKRCGAYFVKQRLPLLFTGTVTRDFILYSRAESNPWKAVRDASSSHVSVLGEVLTTHDIQPILAELRVLSKLKDFEWGVRLLRRSTPLVSSLDPATAQCLVKGEVRCATCSNCSTRLYVDTNAHVRCLHCSSDKKNAGVFCERCAFTLRCHLPHHLLLRIPAGKWCPSLSLLWGPSNVLPLDLFMGRFVSNASDYHFGVYCNRCRRMICGTRWKCAVCYKYDLCDLCARARRSPGSATAKRSQNAKTFEEPPSSTEEEEEVDPDVVPAHHNDATHPMIYIPFAQGSETDKFLQPDYVDSLQAWLDSVPM